MPTVFTAPLPLRRSLPLLGLLLLALGLRGWGLTWGLPSATHYYSYHPDETVLLDWASPPNMNILAGSLLPHWYHYGTLQLSLVCFSNTLTALAGGVDIAPREFPGRVPDWARMYLIGRCLTVGMGVGTVFAVYCIGRRLWGRRAGLLAALTLAVIPLHVQHSHFLTVDVPATFWATLSLLWAVRLATGAPRPSRAALWAGVFAGLAAATKYNLALAILPVIAAAMARFWGARAGGPSAPSLGNQGRREEAASGSSLSPAPRNWGGRTLLALAAFLLAFFATCPGAIWEHAIFWRDLRFEAVHVQNVYDPTFKNTGSGFVYHITHNLDAGLGLPLLIFALISVGYALYRRERGDGLLATFALPYYVLISLAAVRYARYVIPLLPILALWVGRMAAEGTRLPRPALRRLAAGAASVALLATLINAVSLMSVMAFGDTREDALYWLNSFAASPAKIGFAAQPWFGTAPVSPYFTMPRPGGWQQITPPEVQRRIFYAGTDWDAASLISAKPDVVVLSEYDYDDALRLHEPKAAAYLAALKQGYRPVAEFAPLFSTLDGSVERAGLPSRDLPHDMIYPSPAIIIYSRTNNGMQRNE